MFLLAILFVLICSVIGENTENQVIFYMFMYICMIYRSILHINSLLQPVALVGCTAIQELMETEDAIDQLIPLATQVLFVIMVGSTVIKV